MSENENLEEKYGRRKNPSQDIKQPSQEQPVHDNNEYKYGRNNIYTKKAKEEYKPREKDIRANIASVISQYTETHNNISVDGRKGSKKIKVRSDESFIVKFIKSIIVLCILLVIACMGLAIIAKPTINTEADAIIENLNKAEDVYYSSVHKYHYFPKTEYDNTLGVDISACKYFSYYEVIPNEQTGNYEIKLYGATNTFTMAYYYAKAFLKEKGILE